MDVQQVMTAAKDAITVKRVFAEPYEKDGLTVIPAAMVAGGGGGGTGQDAKGQEGEGVGYGVSGRPVGAYVIENGRISWRPAIDVTRIAGMLALVVLTYVLSRPRMVRARAAAAALSHH